MNNKNIFYFLGVILFLVFLSFFFLSSPRDFPLGAVVRIKPGDNLRDVSLLLKQERLIRSRLAFEAFVIIYGGEKRLMSSDFVFENKLPVWQMAKRLAKGEQRLPPIVITVPEGFDVSQIGDVFSSKLTNFNRSKFLLAAQSLEGYLFPDTYFFFTIANEQDVLEALNENFNKKIKPLIPEIMKTGRTEKEIIIMASIVEREAKGDLDRGFISGILWKRISLGMPLQVDAAPETYKNKGLLSSPIANPGLEAIKAAIYPQSSPYLYYLHDKNGMVHYAKSFSEHIQNKLKYLK